MTCVGAAAVTALAISTNNEPCIDRAVYSAAEYAHGDVTSHPGAEHWALYIVAHIRFKLRPMRRECACISIFRS